MASVLAEQGDAGNGREEIWVPTFVHFDGGMVGQRDRCCLCARGDRCPCGNHPQAVGARHFGLCGQAHQR